MSKRLSQKYLLVSIRKGDTESFGQLYDDLAPDIYRFVLFKVDSNEEAEDITSQVFLKTWNYLQDKEAEVRSLRAFIYRIARNLVIDYYRTKARSVHVVTVDPQEAELTTLSSLVDNSVRDMVEQSIDLQVLYQTLHTLKDDYREVILLKYVHDLSNQEISHILNKNNSAVRTQLSRALTALKESIPAEKASTPLHDRTSITKNIKKVSKNRA